MELMHWFIDVVMHLPDHLVSLTSQYGTMTYAILAAIIFCETGLVVTPFLPGDSLLFAAGALCSVPDSGLSVWLMAMLLIGAAVLGDAVNYAVGAYMGPKVFSREDSRWLNRKHLQRTHEFYEKYGGKTIILARFVPIVRTFAPFVAGIGSMKYGRFMTYNVVGAVAWAVTCIFAGYFVGNMPIVKKNFEIVILLIIFISILPGIIGYLKERNRLRAEAATQAAK